jgi:hypothetical protein
MITERGNVGIPKGHPPGVARERAGCQPGGKEEVKMIFTLLAGLVNQVGSIVSDLGALLGGLF